MKKYRDEEVFQKDGFKCVYCDGPGRTFDEWAFLEVDHFKPKYLDDKGEVHELDNLKTSCCICNRMKGGTVYKDMLEARKSLGEMWDGLRRYYEKNVPPSFPLRKGPRVSSNEARGDPGA
jgi:5-methylcytosine-specific restriction endonuclease McrA